MNTESIKECAIDLGAQDCGVASIDRFVNAPDGYRPTDVYSQCKSVIVFIKQMPTDIILANNPVPYTHAAYKMYDEMDQIGMNMCRFFQKNGIKAILIPSDTPYLYWDQANKRGQGIISLKHAAVQAGLGIMGRSTIFINKWLGNMVYIGAVLIDTVIKPNTLVTDFQCPDGCRLCVNACPQQAIGNNTVNQKLCREKSTILAGRNWDIYSCWECRRVCPYRTGKNSN
ncbi:MAG: epoxyqueuosine reductase [Negativicutes bacterium]|jgi:epoxyqueuosine reductase QueG